MLNTDPQTADVPLQVNALFKEMFQLDDAKLKEDQRLVEDLGLDSLDAVDLALRFQRQFHINASQTELMGIKTLGDVYQLVDKSLKLANQQPPVPGASNLESP